MRGPHGVGRVLVAEVDVVGAEVATAKGRVVGHGKARGPAAGEGGVERRADGQDARVDIVAEEGVADVGDVPVDLDVVWGRCLVVVIGIVRRVPRGEVRLAQEVQGPRAGDVELLDVGAGADEDVVRWQIVVVVVVREGQDGGLDRGVAGARVVGAHVDGAVGTALEGVGRLLLALGEGNRRGVGVCGGVVCQGGADKKEAECCCCCRKGTGGHDDGGFQDTRPLQTPDERRAPWPSVYLSFLLSTSFPYGTHTMSNGHAMRLRKIPRNRHRSSRENKQAGPFPACISGIDARIKVRGRGAWEIGALHPRLGSTC